MEFPTIQEFTLFLQDYSRKYARYEYVSPFYTKRKKPTPFKSVYLKINDRYNLFYIYEDTKVYALKELALFLSDYLEGLYPELRAPFSFEKGKFGKILKPNSLRTIHDLNIVLVGKAVNPDKGEF